MVSKCILYVYIINGHLKYVLFPSSNLGVFTIVLACGLDQDTVTVIKADAFMPDLFTGRTCLPFEVIS